MRRPTIIGVTGCIGAGKTTVCEAFSRIGVPSFNYDRAVAEVYLEQFAIDAVRREFGDAFVESGVVNKRMLSEAAFSDPEKLRFLESLVSRPAFEKVGPFLQLHADKPYVLLECARMIDTFIQDECELCIMVRADDAVRMRRVMRRDQLTESQAKLRMSRQMTQDYIESRCDFVIENSGSASVVASVIQTNQLIIDLISNE